MKRTTNILIASLAILLVAVAFVTSKASASTGCFTDTNGHWAETFICWMKDNGISAGYVDGTFRPENAISRAELAVLLGRMRSTGVVQVNSGAPGVWSVNAASAGSGYIDDYTIQSRLRSTSVGSSTFQTTMEIPSSLYNSLMYLNAVKLCYETPNTAYISSVHIYHSFSNATTYREIFDTTDLTGDGCTTFNFSATGNVWGGEYLTISLIATFPATTEYVNIFSTTAYLTPSISPATAKEARDETGTPAQGPESGNEP